MVYYSVISINEEVVMKFIEWIKKFWNHIFIQNFLIILGMFLSFFVLDVSLRYFSNRYVGLFPWYQLTPNLFTTSWILLAIGILYFFPKKIRMILYSIFVLISNIIVYAEYLHFNILKRFFSFSDFFFIKEGSNYFRFALSQTTLKIIFCIIGIFFLYVFYFMDDEKYERD